ncbi:MAG TPA: T9SS type A sorting domain-containing protein, partial [Bacteroidales bacterium]|nr:T9SS type A sorting domain-containing protein [Bacteroidales bacterium]
YGTNNTYSQTCTLQSLLFPTGPAQAELTMTGFNNQVSAFQWTIDYDPAIMTYVSTSDWHTGVSNASVTSPTPGKILFIWGEQPTPAAINGVLCKLNFTYIGPGCSYLNFSNNPIDALVADGMYVYYNVTYVNGQICGGTCSGVTIGTQPLNQGMYATNGTANLHVSANGSAPFTYQWQYDNGTSWVNVVNGAPLGAIYTNANTETLTIAGISAVNTYSYRCYITNCNGVNNATSNPATLTVYTNPASFIYDICLVSVDSISGKNRVIWNKPLTNSIDHFNIYGEGNQPNVYSLLGSVSYDSLSIFVDNSADPMQQAYRYKLSAVDTSGIESTLSNHHRSIHLTINQGIGNTYDLTWTHYEGFTFASYNIYRGTNFSNMTLLATVLNTTNFYTDTTPPAGNQYYHIEAVNPSACTPSKSKIHAAKSNVVQSELSNIIDITMYNNSFRVFPNPAKESFTIEFAENIDNGTFAEIYSIEGKLIKQVSVRQKKTEINISTLPSGIYIVKIAGNNGIAFRKLIKE